MSLFEKYVAYLGDDKESIYKYHAMLYCGCAHDFGGQPARNLLWCASR